MERRQTQNAMSCVAEVNNKHAYEWKNKQKYQQFQKSANNKNNKGSTSTSPMPHLFHSKIPYFPSNIVSMRLVEDWRVECNEYHSHELECCSMHVYPTCGLFRLLWWLFNKTFILKLQVKMEIFLIELVHPFLKVVFDGILDWNFWVV